MTATTRALQRRVPAVRPMGSVIPPSVPACRLITARPTSGPGGEGQNWYRGKRVRTWVARK
jgi:hypothetical protein